MSSDNPIISIDTKKKEHVGGNLHRNGSVYCTKAIEASDMELQKLSNEINMKLKIVHYPPYTSKWNPIEHRVFPHVTRAMEGVPFNTVDEAKNKIESTKTKTGLTVTAEIIQKTYETGKKVAKNFIENIKIKLGNSLPKLNYTISPMEIS